MVLPSHVAGGYVAISVIDSIYPNLGFGSGGLLLAGLVGSVLPDIDFVFFKYVKDHHNSWLHTPIFWIILYVIVFIIGIVVQNNGIIIYNTAFLIGTITHLFLDWFSGRTAGIRISYPFSIKVFSLYPLNPQKGKVLTSLFPTKEHREFFKFYAKNKFLLCFEMSLVMIGFLLFCGKVVLN